MALDYTTSKLIIPGAKVPIETIKEKGLDPFIIYATQRRDELGLSPTAFSLDQLLGRLNPVIPIKKHSLTDDLRDLRNLNGGYYPVSRQRNDGLYVMLVYPDGSGNVRDMIGPYGL